ncbi:MAG: hypothetical protein UX99_C0004G0015 [Candidatus Amesbacteria bacterium GW2011_GWB1_47_26]|uniref:Uncharacterized protein n=1 Tax=Candidatus Amesbacteria bacterium GW2011_GWC2_45_19 TaxID=1618366 RepID=A0A0G1M3Z1_9BACT|nr:MAG: hypothetical protein UX05_C0005G0021 [Candidatus Amesbacteria bacterium GW2011_GWC2_45_19]KKU38373.1 MAG: hypothetical protein UX52_C0007G0026 [Candidatus Amesbacteria bacterium GW2011_GWA1_46_35]KKU68785.1 MAG: hypothetical protein UX93_C0005G0021 [Microgenomates group bacterium GW2011_GWC1_47_20]KKU74915.1 MAG: hypothetical protein UX99_C0004G0015 [Candidatus Amesbacteria bacterium GW2011_GWB1_47_26]KKU80088.1 MAG: hypothetical protein UY06_C0006G0017 [Candidatus Amesbacteria bacteriu
MAHKKFDMVYIILHTFVRNEKVYEKHLRFV